MADHQQVRSYVPFDQASEDHRQIRLLAYDILETELAERGVFITVRSIDKQAATIADGWVYSPDMQDRAPGWAWVKLGEQYRLRPSRIEAALWCPDEDGNEVLGALVYGMVSRHRMYACINFIEKNPEVETQLHDQVAVVAARYLEIHGQLLNCQRIGILHPIPQLVAFYKSLGFEKDELKKGKVMRLYRPLTPKDYSEIVGTEES